MFECRSCVVSCVPVFACALYSSLACVGVMQLVFSPICDVPVSFELGEGCFCRGWKLNVFPRVIMASSEQICGGMSGVDQKSHNTWMCPEGHSFKFRRRPLVSSCVFIFCFFILERASAFMLKTFLYFFFERTLELDPFTPTSGYILISVFFGIHDMAPILISILNDGFLGGYKTIALFGFVYVFGLSLIALFNGSWFPVPLGPSWCSIFALLTLVAVSAGGLVPALTAFGASQFHPQEQTVAGSKFFTFIFVALNLGAIIGVVTAVLLQAQFQYGYVLLACAAAGCLGYIVFLAGTSTYVKRCVHSSQALSTLKLIAHVAWRRSFSKNRASNGGQFSDELVDDVCIFYRLLPVFICLIPLYLGQLQAFTTLRSMGYKLLRPGEFLERQKMPAELILLVEPVTAVLASVLFDQVLFPWLTRQKKMWTHLTRLTVGAVLISLGFFTAFALQRFMMEYSELELKNSLTIFCLVPQLVLFALGQFLIVSSGYALAYTHAPDSIKAVSVSVFSLIYSFGSVLSVCIFAAMRSWLDEPDRKAWDGSFVDESITARFDVYYLIVASLCCCAVFGLVSLRRFYSDTRDMKIEREIEQKALQLVLVRLELQLTSPTSSTTDSRNTCRVHQVWQV